MSRRPSLTVSNLSVSFRTPRGMVQVLDQVDLEIAEGETVALVGESGSGKSVTSLACMGLLPETAVVTADEIAVGGTSIHGLRDAELAGVRGDRVSMIFQEPMTSLNPAFTIADQIGAVYRRHTGASRSEARARTEEMLRTVGIPDPKRRLDSYPHEFSGGMRQRVMIAMALVCEPEIVIADEPTTALDVTVQAQVLRLLAEMQDRFGMGLLFITHDLGVVRNLADRIVVMYAGQIVEQSTNDELFGAPLHPYSTGLIASLPEMSAPRSRLQSIAGMPPSPTNLPAGCRFSPRCPRPSRACHVEAQTLEPVGTNRIVRCWKADPTVPGDVAVGPRGRHE